MLLAWARRRRVGRAGCGETGTNPERSGSCCLGMLLADQFAVGLDERTVGLREAAARERFEADSAEVLSGSAAGSR